MFAIVASSFALAVYMVKLLKELVEPSDIFLQCLRSHLSVPSTEVRGRGPVSRRHRAPRRTTPERPESGYALGFAARASAFFQGRASGPEQRPRTMPSVLGKAVQEDSTSVSRQNAEQPSERFLLSKTPALLRAKTVVPVSRLMYASTPRKRSDVHSRPISPTWNEETEEEVYPPRLVDP
ncbi:uncharacterized protein [Dermacentor andersoni]|uniref:uncharacterized protein isoform X8 n=1 Tax=Dermacentor andersoni TaxID=34620 RepID=UPI00241726B8|nr:uncharacterized protein LOC129382271 isoform X9 [Dermacentor andersoni]XP_054921966.1 uncharacterized protein LOC129382271 isoform X9 [Dermacentor andersoni]